MKKPAVMLVSLRGRLSCVTTFTTPVIVERNPGKAKGPKCENVSQRRYLTIEATIQLCTLSPG